MAVNIHTYAQCPAVAIRLQGNATSDQDTQKITDAVIDTAQQGPGFILLNCCGLRDGDRIGVLNLLLCEQKALTHQSNVILVSPTPPLLEKIQRVEEQYGFKTGIPIFRTHGAAIETLNNLPKNLAAGADELRDLLASYGRSSFIPEPYNGTATAP